MSEKQRDSVTAKAGTEVNVDRKRKRGRKGKGESDMRDVGVRVEEIEKGKGKNRKQRNIHDTQTAKYILLVLARLPDNTLMTILLHHIVHQVEQISKIK